MSVKSCIPEVLAELRSFITRAQNAIQALQELERDGIIPFGTVVGSDASSLPPDPNPDMDPGILVKKIIPPGYFDLSVEVKKRKRRKQKSTTAGEERVCSKCRKSKSIDAFPSRGGVCRECIREYQRNWQAMKRGKKPPNSQPSPNTRASTTDQNHKGDRRESLTHECKVCHARFLTPGAMAVHNCLNKQS